MELIDQESKYNAMKFTKFIFIIIISLWTFYSCAKDVEDQRYKDNNDSAVFLYPSPEDFCADGTTVSGDESYLAVVTIRKGSATHSDLTWTAAIEGEPSWAHLSTTKVSSSFQDEFSKEFYQINEKGISISLDPNEGYRRFFTIIIKVSDGNILKQRFSQAGIFPDASVTSKISDVEFRAEGGPIDISYTSNMGDAVNFFASYDGNSIDWLSWTTSSLGSVTLSASAWDDQEKGRFATFYIVVGSEDTSIDTLAIPINQLAKDKYYYMYGPSAGNTTIENAIQLDKNPDKTYSVKAYFLNSTGNHIFFNLNSRTLSYPYFALTADGKIAEIKSETSIIPDGPEIDIDGMKILEMSFDSMTWEWKRISTQNCLPDELVSEYSTKEYIARDGSCKTWMTEWFHWDGGEIRPKLGSLIVPSATGIGSAGTGGYNAANFPSSWDAPTLNANFETTEIGGNLEGTSDEGRFYTFEEAFNGVPRYGIGYARRENMPENFQKGTVFTDAVGSKIIVEFIPEGGGLMSGDNAQDEKDHPMLTMQLQGICPYGWHIANASDWLDLAFAASKASTSHTHPVNEAKITYKQFFDNVGSKNLSNDNSDRGIGNLAAWLRNSSWAGGTHSDGSDEFGFNYRPIGWRYMTQGYQCYGHRVQALVPLTPKSTQAYRVNVILDNDVNYAEMVPIDNGQAIMPFRCVKNYYKK